MSTIMYVKPEFTYVLRVKNRNAPYLSKTLLLKYPEHAPAGADSVAAGFMSQDRLHGKKVAHICRGGNLPADLLKSFL